MRDRVQQIWLPSNIHHHHRWADVTCWLFYPSRRAPNIKSSFWIDWLKVGDLVLIIRIYFLQTFRNLRDNSALIAINSTMSYLKQIKTKFLSDLCTLNVFLITWSKNRVQYVHTWNSFDTPFMFIKIKFEFLENKLWNNLIKIILIKTSSIFFLNLKTYKIICSCVHDGKNFEYEI